MKHLYFLFSIAFSAIIYAQAPSIAWQKTIGSELPESSTYSKITADGGLILVCRAYTGVSGEKTVVGYGNTDIWIIKTDNLGVIEWQKAIGGDSFDYPTAILQNPDESYVIGGNSDSNISGDKSENCFGLSDFWVLKLDNAGNIIWQHTIGGAGEDTLKSLIATADGGYLLGGVSNSSVSGNKTESYRGLTVNKDYWVVKTDSLGNIEWDKTIGGFDNDYLTALAMTSDNNYLVGGYSYSSNTGDKTETNRGEFDDYWIVKLDTSGTKAWDKTIGGNSGEDLHAITATDDGGTIIGGHSGSPISGEKTVAPVGFPDIWILKLDMNGNIEWQKSIGNNGTYNLLTTVFFKPNDGYLIGAFSDGNISFDKTENSRGDYDVWLIKLDLLGNIVWDKTIGGDMKDVVLSIDYDQTTQSYILGCSSESGVSGDKTDFCRGLNDYWLVKLEPENLATNQSSQVQTKVFPNPTTEAWWFETKELIKSIEIADISGKIVFAETYAANSCSVNATQLTAGLYLATLKTDRGSGVVKLIKK